MPFNRSDRSEEQRSRRPGGIRKKRRVCVFCTEGAKPIDCRDVATLEKYIPERGKIPPHHIVGNCARYQRVFMLTIKRARRIALLPYQVD